LVHAFGWNVAEHEVSNPTMAAGTTSKARKLIAEWRAMQDSISSDVGAIRIGGVYAFWFRYLELKQQTARRITAVCVRHRVSHSPAFANSMSGAVRLPRSALMPPTLEDDGSM
jgi:hypothetical protein